MSHLKQAGFQAGDILAQLNNALQSFTDEEKKSLQKKTNAIFELQIKNKEGVETTWTIDVKNEPRVYKGAANPKPGVTIIMPTRHSKAWLRGSLTDKVRI